MKIIGPELLVFGVDQLPACSQFLTDYGLKPVGVDARGGRYEALDGTAVEVRAIDDPSLPPALGTGNMFREVVYGVQDAASLAAIRAELSKDRDVQLRADGSIACVDDSGFALRFQLSVRRPYQAPPALVNAPGQAPQRGPNLSAVDPAYRPLPRTLSHVVFFVPDAARAEAFYERIGFKTTDRFAGVGPFMRPAGTLDHHTLFLIQTPPFMRGVEHFTFHMGSINEVLVAGYALVKKGYQSFWGPGRHIFGSNWFWYFNSPLGVHIEYDADMDLHDDAWVAREAPIGTDTSQIFNFTARDKFLPGGPPPGAAPPAGGGH
jgi:catechol 2,3-dioxygenase-like lactoylglutathione lyase family enzyme